MNFFPWVFACALQTDLGYLFLGTRLTTSKRMTSFALKLMGEHHRQQFSELNLRQQLSYQHRAQIDEDRGCFCSHGWGISMTRIISSSRPITGSYFHDGQSQWHWYHIHPRVLFPGLVVGFGQNHDFGNHNPHFHPYPPRLSWGILVVIRRRSKVVEIS